MMAGGPRQQEQRKANVRLGVILASVAIIFALGFMARMWLIGG